MANTPAELGLHVRVRKELSCRYSLDLPMLEGSFLFALYPTWCARHAQAAPQQEATLLRHCCLTPTTWNGKRINCFVSKVITPVTHVLRYPGQYGACQPASSERTAHVRDSGSSWQHAVLYMPPGSVPAGRGGEKGGE